MSSTVKVILDKGIDITEYLTEYPTIPFGRSNYGDFPSLGNISIDLDNTNQLFNPQNDKSFFYGNNWQGWDSKIYEVSGEDLIWEGVLSNLSISNNMKKTSLSMLNRFTLYLDKIIPYYSEDLKSPAEIAKNICILYGIPYDNASFTRSANIQELNGVIISANINFENNLNLYDGLKMLADVGVARLYIWKNKLYYDTYDQDYSNSLIYVPNNVIWKIDPLQTLDRNPLTSYSIVTESGVAITGGVETDEGNLKTLDLSYNNPFSTASLTGANYIGNTYMEISQKTIYQVDIQMKRGYALILEPTSKLNINLPPYIYDTNFEIMNIDNSGNLYSNIQGQSL